MRSPTSASTRTTASATTQTPPDTEAPTAPGTPDRHERRHEADHLLDRRDRQRRGHALPRRALPRRELLELRGDRDDRVDDLPEHGPHSLHLLLVPRPRTGRRAQLRRLLGDGERDHADGRRPAIEPLAILDTFNRRNENPLSDAGRWSTGSSDRSRRGYASLRTRSGARRHRRARPGATTPPSALTPRSGRG